MQTLSDPSSAGGGWSNLTWAVAALLAGIGALTRWVIAPAITTYNRRDLQAELGSLRKLEDSQMRQAAQLERMDATLTALAGVPETLARLEERLTTLLKERKHS